MRKSIFVSLLVLGIVAGTAAQQCQFPWEIPAPFQRPGFCMDDCSSYPYLNCPDSLFIPFMAAEYCGFVNGAWRNFTFTCDVCNSGGEGFYFGSCTCADVECDDGFYCDGGNCVANPTCETLFCGYNEICKDNKCVKLEPEPVPEPPKDPCEGVVCSDPLDTCQFGTCFRKFDFFCSAHQPMIIRNYCPIRLLTREQCPPNMFVQHPEHLYCGVSVTGQLIDFASECEVCRLDRHYMQYYYAMPCSQVPRACNHHEQCKDGSCQLIDTCAGVNCYEGTTCNNGVCIPIPGYCALNSQCDFGLKCENNECVPDPLSCQGVVCGDHQECVLGECKDLCLRTQCPENYSCLAGICFGPLPPPIPPTPPVPDCSTSADCNQYENCIEGECVIDPNAPCSVVGCQTGFYCHPYARICVPSASGYCSTSRECTKDKVCIGSKCQRMQCDSMMDCHGHACKNSFCQNPY